MPDFEVMPIGTRQLLEDCATQFRYYADIHDAKGTYEGRKKADANLVWYNKIRKLLDGTARCI